MSILIMTALDSTTATLYSIGKITKNVTSFFSFFLKIPNFFSGEHPISRSLYIYVNADESGSNPAIRSYVDYFMSEGFDTAVREVGYVSLGDDSKQETRSNWVSRKIG